MYIELVGLESRQLHGPAVQGVMRLGNAGMEASVTIDRLAMPPAV